MTLLWVETPVELWEICSRVGGPEIGWGAFPRRFSILSENGNRLGPGGGGGLGDISIRGRSCISLGIYFG